MEKPRRLTQEEREQRRAELDAFYEKRKSDPERVKMREWIKEAFKADIDAICDFALALKIECGSLRRENESLVKKLNSIYTTSFGLSPDAKIPGYMKYNIAKLGLEIDSQDPASLAFVSGLDVSKELQARKNAFKGHAKNTKARDFVRHEWTEHKAAYQGNKSAFSRDYVRRVKHEFDVDITEKQMREVWLANTPLASKQAGKLANR
ncbi:MAG: hypothetical protein WA924_11620 [Burkholderiaceae bacterium]